MIQACTFRPGLRFSARVASEPGVRLSGEAEESGGWAEGEGRKENVPLSAGKRACFLRAASCVCARTCARGLAIRHPVDVDSGNSVKHLRPPSSSSFLSSARRLVGRLCSAAFFRYPAHPRLKRFYCNLVTARARNNAFFHSANSSLLPDLLLR